MMIHTSNFLKHFSMKKKLHCEPIKSETRLENVKDKFVNVFSIYFFRSDASLAGAFLFNLIITEETIIMYIGEIYSLKHPSLLYVNHEIENIILLIPRIL